jgi:hypothetical protein
MATVDGETVKRGDFGISETLYGYRKFVYSGATRHGTVSEQLCARQARRILSKVDFP